MRVWNCPGRQWTFRPAGPRAAAEVSQATGCVSVDGCDDGRMMTDDDWRVNDREGETVSPELPNNHVDVSSGSGHISRRGIILSRCPLPTLSRLGSPSGRSGCLQPVLRAALPGPSLALPRWSVVGVASGAPRVAAVPSRSRAAAR